MTTFLSFLGLVFIFLIIKFMYDTYLSNNDVKSTAGIDNTFDGNYLSKVPVEELSENNDVKNLSLISIANGLGCSVEDTEYYFINGLIAFGLSAKDMYKCILDFDAQKNTQSISAGVHPNDTPAALMQKWTLNYFNDRGFVDKVRTQNEVMEDYLFANKELADALKSGDESQLNMELKKEGTMLSEIVHRERPAQKYLDKVESMADSKKNLADVIRIIDRGLLLGDVYNTPFLYTTKSKIQLSNGEYTQAELSASEAIASLNDELHNINYCIQEMLELRSKARWNLGKILDAQNDESLKIIYAAKYDAKIEEDAKLIDDNDEYEVPF